MLTLTLLTLKMFITAFAPTETRVVQVCKPIVVTSMVPMNDHAFLVNDDPLNKRPDTYGQKHHTPLFATNLDQTSRLTDHAVTMWCHNVTMVILTNP